LIGLDNTNYALLEGLCRFYINLNEYISVCGRTARGTYGLSPLKRCDREFEYRSRHVFLCLSCTCRVFSTSRSPVQGILHYFRERREIIN